MDFRGHLRLPEDAGSGIPVALRLDDIFVIISSGDDELGTWRADDVVVERIFSNQFAIELDGESMVFIAQDALGFAYEGISAIEDLQERLTKRRVFKRSKKRGKQAEAVPADVESAPDPAPVPPAPAAVASAAPAPAAEEEVPSFEPKAIWTPPAAAARSTSPAQTPSPADFEPVAPEPVRQQVESEITEPAPADARVSYPRHAQAPPVAEPASPLFEPVVRAEPVEPPAEAPAEPVGPWAEPIVPPADDPQAVPTEAQIVPDVVAPAAPEPDPRLSAPEPQAEPATPEYEVEEVAAASTGATWGDDDIAVNAEAAPAEIEIEEYFLPSAGAAEMYPVPASESEPEPEPQDIAPAPPEQPVVESVPPDSARESAVAPVDSQPAEVVAETPAVESAPAGAEEVPASAEEDAVAPGSDRTDAAPTEDIASSNGHSLAPETKEALAKRERRHSLFGRSRDKKIPAHDHRYGDPKTIGGLTRQVCEICGHVTFSGEDVYQGW